MFLPIDKFRGSIRAPEQLGNEVVGVENRSENGAIDKATQSVVGALLDKATLD